MLLVVSHKDKLVVEIVLTAGLGWASWLQVIYLFRQNLPLRFVLGSLSLFFFYIHRFAAFRCFN